MAIVLGFALGIKLLPKHGYLRVAHVVDGLFDHGTAAKNDVTMPMPATGRSGPFVANESSECARFIGFVGRALSALPLIGHGIAAGKILVVANCGWSRIIGADDGQ